MKTALEKKQRPFSSELYKSLIRYTEKAGGSGDISEANAKILISAESIIGPIFTKFGTSKLKLEDQSDFQLKAIAFFQSKGLDLNLLRQPTPRKAGSFFLGWKGGCVLQGRPR